MRARAAIVAAALAFGLLAAPAARAETRVLDSCVATVTEGDELALSPLAVLDPVVSVLAPLDPLNVLVPAFETAWRATPPIELPAAGPAGIAGDVIADAVLARLTGISVVGPVLDVLVGPVHGLLAGTCRITVVRAEAPPADPVTAPPPPPPTLAPPEPSLPAGGPAGGGAPSEPPPYQGDGPAGALPAPGSHYEVQSTVPQAQFDSVALGRSRVAATAEALPADDPRPWESPAILAALLIALVGIQLGRTWILRRTDE
ncbi:hypothetical protein [Amycolatopsis tucumanensis]|uniref:hypothetical protein n=1 Tax=Amycolatopsis tucumanensis TaxID=401106 RepID=UPI003D711608